MGKTGRIVLKVAAWSGGVVLVLFAGLIVLEAIRNPQVVDFLFPPPRADISDSEAIIAHMQAPPTQIRLSSDGYFGRAYVDGAVDEAGHFIRTRILRENNRPSEAYRLAVRQAKTWRFTPFVRDGKPVTTQIELEIPVLPRVRVPSRHVPFPAGDASNTTIRLVRTSCLGTCPIYQVEIDGAGGVTYDGYGYVAALGRRTAKIPPDRVASLLQKFREADFLSLDDRYVAREFDIPASCLTLTIGSQTKTVVDYMGPEVGMPDSVRSLQNAVDEVSGAKTWVRGQSGADRPPPLERTIRPNHGNGCEGGPLS